VSNVPVEVRTALLRQYGTASQAYSATYQDELEHFGDERGFIAYKTVWGTALALSDPIAPPENLGDLICRFTQRYKDIGFWYVSRPIAQLLATRGFSINQIGQETRIDLGGYDFRGNHKQSLRAATNQIAKSGTVIRESTFTTVGLERMRALSEQWRRTRTIANREVAFLNRPLVLGEEPDVRRFFAFARDGEPVAFNCFDPIYDGGEVVGYMCQHSRHAPQADSRVHRAIKRLAIETFQREGRKILYLGLAPFAHIKNDDFRAERSYLVWRSFRFAYRSRLINRYVYPLQGLEAHKRRFRGVWEPAYYAFNKFPSLPRVFKMLRASKII
jgi:lysylphosphatidylglycerol synthetase-like protein (DUF2156 family)